MLRKEERRSELRIMRESRRSAKRAEREDWIGELSREITGLALKVAGIMEKEMELGRKGSEAALNLKNGAQLRSNFTNGLLNRKSCWG